MSKVIERIKKYSERPLDKDVFYYDGTRNGTEYLEKALGRPVRRDSSDGSCFIFVTYKNVMHLKAGEFLEIVYGND